MGVIEINISVTSREEILKTCRRIVSKEGLASLNMRHVAEECKVALGSLYHYFPSKDEMITATVESVWLDIFHMDQKCKTELPFPEYVRLMFESVRKSTDEYPDFFMAHSVSFANSAKSDAHRRMTGCFSHMKEAMEQVLEKDPGVRPSAFSDAFPKADFIDFVFSALLFSLVQEKENCDVLTEMIRRTIYLP